MSFCFLYNVVSENYSVQIPPGGGGGRGHGGVGWGGGITKFLKWFYSAEQSLHIMAARAKNRFSVSILIQMTSFLEMQTKLCSYELVVLSMCYCDNPLSVVHGLSCIVPSIATVCSSHRNEALHMP